MSWLDTIGHIIGKPQSILSGATLGAARSLGLADDQSSYLPGADNPLTGLLAGIQGNIKPAQVLDEGFGNHDAGLARKIMNTAFNATYDPLILAGPAARGGALGEKAAAIFGAEGTEPASKLAAAAAKAARRTYAGTLATDDNNPLSGLGAGAIGGLVAEKAAPAIGPILQKLGILKAPELAAELADTVPSAIKELGPAPLSAAAKRAASLTGEVPSTGEVFAPQITKELSGPAAKALPVGPSVPEILALPVGSGASTVPPIELGPRVFSMGGPQESMDDLLRKLAGTGIEGDRLAQVFRAALK